MSDKNAIPTIEEFISHIGACKELYEDIDLFITNGLNAEKKLAFSRDSNARGWGMEFKSASKYFGTVIAEKDAFTVVMRLTDDQIKRLMMKYCLAPKSALIIVIEQATAAGFNAGF